MLQNINLVPDQSFQVLSLLLLGRHYPDQFGILRKIIQALWPCGDDQ
jgi:hypothetical protein